MWAGLLDPCQVWGISSVLHNPPPADTSYMFFPPFLFSLIHPIKKHVTRTRYGHSSSPARAQGWGTRRASPVPHALPANGPFERPGSAPCLASGFQCELLQVLGLICASKTEIISLHLRSTVDISTLQMVKEVISKSH